MDSTDITYVDGVRGPVLINGTPFDLAMVLRKAQDEHHDYEVLIGGGDKHPTYPTEEGATMTIDWADWYAAYMLGALPYYMDIFHPGDPRFDRWRK